MVTIKVTERQAHLINSALDLYVRLNLGQFDRLIYDVPTIHDNVWNNHRDEWHDFASEELKTLRNKLFDFKHGMNYSHGINSDKVSDYARLAQDIHEVIRHEFWKNNPNSSRGTIDSDITRRSGFEPEKISVTIERE